MRLTQLVGYLDLGSFPDDGKKIPNPDQVNQAHDLLLRPVTLLPRSPLVPSLQRPLPLLGQETLVPPRLRNRGRGVAGPVLEVPKDFPLRPLPSSNAPPHLVFK